MSDLYEAVKSFTDRVCEAFKETLESADRLHNDSNVKKNGGKWPPFFFSYISISSMSIGLDDIFAVWNFFIPILRSLVLILEQPSPMFILPSL